MEDIRTESKTRKRLLLAAKIFLPLIFFGYIFGLSMNYPLNDPDLYWHLKTGQYVLENWSVPEEDPFAYTTPKPLSISQKIGLRSQWLGQVLFYAAYSIGGYPGIGIMRNILLMLPMLILYLWLIDRGVKPWTAIIIGSMAAFMFAIQLFYSFERPQGISFFCSIVVIMLVERLRLHARQGHLTNLPSFDISYVLLPLVMALWSNIHAGYIMGNIIILTYMASEVLRLGWGKLRGKPGNSPYMKALFIVGAISVAASFLNPNLHRLFINYVRGILSMFIGSITQSGGGGGGWVENVVLEYKSLYYFYENLGYRWLTFYWLLIGFLYLLMIVKYWQKKSIDVAEVLVVSIITFFANYYARGLMFSLAILPFYVGKTISEIEAPKLGYKVILNGAVAVVLSLAIGFVTFSYKRAPHSFKPGVTPMWVTPWYPTRAVEFLKVVNPPGPMYNFYTWGGFLIWTLYPQYQVFIDGRALDDMVNRTADEILKTYPGWQGRLDAYNINFIFTPLIFRESGHIIPLATALVNDNRWILIFVKNNSAIFIRNVPQNEKIIYTFEIDKSHIYRQIIEVEEIFLSSSPDNAVYNLAKAEAMFALGMYPDAKRIYERFPEQSMQRLLQLTEMGY